MKIVPVIKSGDLDRSVRFYTEVLDFERKWPGYEDREKANGVAHLMKDGEQLLLSRHAGDGGQFRILLGRDNPGLQARLELRQ